MTERVLDWGSSKGDIRVKPEYDYKEKEAEHVKKEKIILSFPGLIWESLNCRIKSDNDGKRNKPRSSGAVAISGKV